MRWDARGLAFGMESSGEDDGELGELHGTGSAEGARCGRHRPRLMLKFRAGHRSELCFLPGFGFNRLRKKFRAPGRGLNPACLRWQNGPSTRHHDPILLAK